MARFKIVERSSEPGVKNSQKKLFYASPITDRALDGRTFAKLATSDASLSAGEMSTALELFGKTALQQLLQGHSVEIPDIGTLRISFSSKGSETVEGFNARTMISNPRILFKPKPEVREAIKNGMYYENAGVRAGGKDYVSLSAYKKAMGTGGTTGGGSGSTGGNSNNDDVPVEDRP